MTAVVVQTAPIARSSYGSGDLVFSFSSAPTAGSTIIVIVSSYHATSGEISGVTVGATAAVLDASYSTFASVHSTIWRVADWPGGANTITVTPVQTTGHNITACAMEVTGLMEASPIGVTVTNSSSGSPADLVSGGLVPTPQLVVGLLSLTGGDNANGIVSTSGTSMMIESDGWTYNACAASYAIASSPVGTTLSWTIATAPSWNSIIISYKEIPPPGATHLRGVDADNASTFTPVVDVSAGAADEGGIPRLQADGKLHPSVSPAEIIMEWDTPGTYTGIARPDPAVYPNCEVLLIGGGGGGGSGRRGGSSSICRGGGGASGGQLFSNSFATSLVSPTFAVTVGAGGNGGAQVTSDSTDGAVGSDGGDSSLSVISPETSPQDLIVALGGLGGRAGSDALSGSTTARTSWVNGISAGAAGGGSNAGSGTPSDVAFNSQGLPWGGAGGASHATTASGDSSGANVVFYAGIVTTLGGTSASPNGNNGTTSSVYGNLSTGGGGGAAILAGAGGNGGNGIRGSGGGGGGGSRNGNNSGAGGNGGNGYVRLRFYA